MHCVSLNLEIILALFVQIIIKVSSDHQENNKLAAVSVL